MGRGSEAWSAVRRRVARIGAAMWRHKIRSAVGIVVVLVALAVITALAWVRGSASGHIYALDRVPPAPVGIVLGAGLQPDGTPTPYLAARLRVAVSLYGQHRIRVILVSGDNSRRGHDEVGAMDRWLRAHHVPAAKIVEDHAGFDTYDSCQRARRIFGVDHAVIVTQGFHLPREIFLCRQAGIRADGVASPAIGGHPAMNTIREVPASVKAAWDAMVDPGPRYLGPHDDAVQRALAG